ncbi:MAG: hypothetical protein JNK05_37115 [Myxococcales bacterium]|nr:hypothetical protein [Myxococcales bacterium]
MASQRAIYSGVLSIVLLACSGPPPIEVEDVSQPFDAAARDSSSDTMRFDRESSVDARSAGPSCVDSSADHAALVAGVRRINLGSNLASSYVIHGPRAFAVVFDRVHTPFVAASRAGAGRVFAVGHESIVYEPTNTTDDRGVLVRNAMSWLAAGRSGVTVGLQRDVAALRAFLTSNGYSVRTVDASSLDARTAVWVVDASATLSDAEHANVVRWVEAGGGLVVAGHAWLSGQSNRDVATQFRGNRTLSPLGLTLTAEADARVDGEITPTAPTDDDHALCALDRVREHRGGSRVLPLETLTIAGATARRAVRTMPIDGPYIAAARALRADLPDVVPTLAAPVRPPTQPVEALALAIDVRLARDLPVDELRAHPASRDFPGAVPDSAPRERVEYPWSLEQIERSPRVLGDSGAPVWRSIGVYAPPGAVLTVTVSAAAATGGLSVLIGAHTDDNSALDRWDRVPAITRTFEIRSRETRVASAFGGLVYIRFPAQFSLDGAWVSITGGVRAGRFVAGATSPEQWLIERERQAPWVELETGALVLTVPRAAVASLSDPTALVNFWNTASDTIAILGRLSVGRARSERIVFDRQIVAGLVHAGYPIMAQLPQVPESLDFATLQRVGHWGFFHELGRNHQYADWTWSQTSEATASLYACYAMEFAVRLAPRTGHPALAPAERARRIEQFIAGGRNFARDWNAWTALETFLQLQEFFEWRLFHDLNQAYLHLPVGDRPRTDDEKIQRLVIETSRSARRDLSPFFTAWGFPVSAETRAITSVYPSWAENPMR